MKILLISFSLLISLSSFSSTGIDCLVNDGNPHKSLEIKEFSQAEFASFDYDNSYFIGVTLLQKGEYIYNVGVYNNAPKELVYRVYHVDNEGKKTLEFYISENGKGYLESSTHLSHVKNDVAVSCEYKNH